MTTSRRWFAVVVAFGCGPTTPRVSPPSPPTAALWSACESLFNRRELDRLGGYFNDGVDFDVATVSGASRVDLRARLGELIESNPGIRSRTQMLFYRDNLAVAVVGIHASEPERSQLALVVATISGGKISALRLYMDPFVFRRTDRPITFAWAGRVVAHEPTADQRRWLRALSASLSAKSSKSPVVPSGTIHYAASGSLRGPAIGSFLRQYTRATDSFAYRIVPLLGAGQWVVAEGEWRGSDGTSSGRAQGILARVDGGVARELWLFDPMLSASVLLRLRGHPRH